MTEENLNPQQQTAVHHIEGPLLVLAGAGSGKTRIITYRIAHLLSLGVPASEILAVTFTNKAAEEMRQRIHQLTRQAVLTCTFHSLCAKILRESISILGFSPQFSIYDEEDSEKALRHCFALLQKKADKGELKRVRSQISQAKNGLLTPELLFPTDKDLAELYSLYQQQLKASQALDFDDLLFLTVQLFRFSPEVLSRYQQRWHFILIDEYQDTNLAQYTLAMLLAQKHQNVFAVGDPDQSIYSWRGANIRNILHFRDDFPGATVLPLEQNYRSRSNILQAANALIRNNCNRYEKNLWSNRGPGENIHLHIAENDHGEAEFVIHTLRTLHREKQLPFKECVIFYRTNFQSRIFEDHLLKERIPYIIIGGISFYHRKEIKDILSLLRFVLSGADYVGFGRTINLRKRGLGETFVEKLRDYAVARQETLFETCSQIIEGKIPCKLSLKQREGLTEYIDTVSILRTMIAQGVSLHELFLQAIERFKYREYLKEDPETFEERLENIEELISKAAEWEQEVEHPTLAAFLEELSLKSSMEESVSTGEEVRLMTLHNGKGLEFTAVFLVGMEEDLFPHINAKDHPEALEEERRLCYVGMTRAKEYLFLSASRFRYLWGTPRYMSPSRFLQEIPKKYLETVDTAISHVEKETISEDPESFPLGSKVTHKDFGTGVIQKNYQTSLGLTYDVYFLKDNITRSLVAKFAKLIPIAKNTEIF